MAKKHDTSKWYEAGLGFACTQCGNCCSGAPGYVWVTPEEIDKIAEFLNQDTLTKDQLRRVGRGWSLTELKTGECIFLKKHGDKRVCGIYPVRPLQCRTWPFWDMLLESPDTWNQAGKGCPGMNKGPSHSFVQIEIRRTAKTWEDLPS